MQIYAKPCQTMQIHAKPCQTMQSHAKPALSQCLRVEFPEYPEYAEYPKIGVPEYPYGYSNVLGPLQMSQS